MSEAVSIQTISTVWPLMSMPRMSRGVLAGLVGVVGQLDAAGLAPAADLDLGLDHDRVAEALGGGHGVVHGGRRPRPALTGMSKEAKNCLPWYSKRSTAEAT